MTATAKQIPADIDADGTTYRQQTSNIRTVVDEVNKDGQPTGKKIVKKVPTIGWMASRGNHSAWGADRALAKAALEQLLTPPTPKPSRERNNLTLASLTTNHVLERINAELQQKNLQPLRPRYHAIDPNAKGTHKHKTKPKKD
jgi:hypothetical protein